MVLQRVLLSESEATLFDSAPSRPDVPAFKGVGVACSLVSRTVFKSACSLPADNAARSDRPVQKTTQCKDTHTLETLKSGLR